MPGLQNRRFNSEVPHVYILYSFAKSAVLLIKLFESVGLCFLHQIQYS